MRKSLLVLASFSLFAAVASPQDEAQYKEWMRSTNAAVRAIRSAPDNAAAKEDATKLADTFDKVAAFWKEKHADDAVAAAEKGRDAAKAIASGQGDKAANLQAIQSTCVPCHTAHRGGSAPNFTIK